MFNAPDGLDSEARAAVHLYRKVRPTVIDPFITHLESCVRGDLRTTRNEKVNFSIPRPVQENVFTDLRKDAVIPLVNGLNYVPSKVIASQS